MHLSLFASPLFLSFSFPVAKAAYVGLIKGVPGSGLEKERGEREKEREERKRKLIL